MAGGIRPYKGRWVRSESYAGAWEHIREVPSALLDFPSDYRAIPLGYSRIPYGEILKLGKMEAGKVFGVGGERIDELEKRKYRGKKMSSLSAIGITWKKEISDLSTRGTDIRI